MKWLIGITGVILLIYVILTAAVVPAGRTTAAEVTGAITDDSGAKYTAREEGGRIVIFEGDTQLVKTNTMVNQLPKADRLRLQRGIGLFSDKELKRFLEDYCS